MQDAQVTKSLNSVKTYLQHFNLRLWHALPVVVNDSDFSISRAFAKFRENKTLTKISEFTVFKAAIYSIIQII